MGTMTLKKLIREQGFDTTVQAVMKEAEPKTRDEAVQMMATLVKALTMTMAWECERHITDHDGYDCADSIIESLGEKVKSEAASHLDVLLGMLDKPELRVAHNQRVREEILREMDYD
jgi:hypothetical protein